MATFYIDSPSEGILELTSTTDIRISEAASVSKHPLETGETIVDNVVVENVTVDFSGVISNVRKIAQRTNQSDLAVPNEYEENVEGSIKALRRIKEAKELFRVVYDNRFLPFENCVLTSLSMDRNAQTGLGYNVSLSFEQVRIVGRATTSISRSVQRNPDITQGKTNGGANNQKQNQISESFFIKGGTGLIDLATEVTKTIHTTGNEGLPE
jgi:hypothetical protein